VLVENLHASSNRYTVKRYRSEKAISGEEWHHKRIWLESINPKYDPILLQSDEDYRVIAEFVRVLD
jgi:SOS-response transcriptional repressor LexA